MKRARTGKTLIELLVVVTLLSIVMAMAVTTLSALFRTRQRLSREAEEDLALSRLASRLRADVHQAIRCEASKSLNLISADDQIIAYTIEPSKITREVRREDAVKHRDAFLLPSEAVPTFTCEEAAGGEIVRLTVRPGRTPGNASPLARTVTIEAALDLPPRLAGRSGIP